MIMLDNNEDKQRLEDVCCRKAFKSQGPHDLPEATRAAVDFRCPTKCYR